MNNAEFVWIIWSVDYSENVEVFKWLVSEKVWMWSQPSAHVHMAVFFHATNDLYYISTIHQDFPPEMVFLSKICR